MVLQKAKYGASWRIISRDDSYIYESTVKSGEEVAKQNKTEKKEYTFEYVGDSRAVSKATLKTDGVVSAVKTLSYQ